ncbi:PDC sensor domain-containing protein [Nitratifractor sp.]|uniref:PDC sensor domain-containing protein n=1 Tax=Nitratifractor sp. TaxID=2268144 RepID=UPI0025F6EF62|nr:PDC sensor domain-containing protein [Nitratifractor sp.]
MKIKEIQEFADIRTKARAYLCYIMERNLPNRLPGITLDDLVAGMKRISNEIGRVDSIYVLDPLGRQVTNTVSTDPQFARKGAGENRSNRAYYYRVVREKRCVLTDPYPSLGGNKLVVTAAYPIFDEKGEMIYIVCVDITLENILNFVHPTSIDSYVGTFNRWIYGAFSVALFAVALLLFVKAIDSFITYGMEFKQITVKDMFQSTILLTLSLAIFDLVKAIFEEEVLGSHKKHAEDDIHKTMVRFLGSIIIALAIEALMLVFKFAITDPNKLLYAVGLLLGITALMLGLSVYLRAIDRTRRR